MLELLRRIDGLVDQAVERPTWPLSDADLIEAAAAAHALEQRAAAIRLACVREVDARGIAVAQGASSTAAWLRDRLRISAPAARRTVDLAAALAVAPPVVADALAAGRITVEQSQAIVHSITDLPGQVGSEVTAKAADLLVGFGTQFEPAILRRLGRRVLDHVAPDEAEAADLASLDRQEERTRTRRYVTLSAGPEGAVRLTGMLDAETAGLLHAALDPLAGPSGVGDDRSPGQRRHDALGEVCRLALRTGDLPASGGDRPQLVITTGFDAVARQLGAGTLDTGLRLTPTTVRRLACDAAILPAVLGGNGQVLDLGRQRRLITGPLRRALVLRDRGCAFPGCDRPPRWCDGHHVRAWHQGGPTALGNAVLLCGHHHRVVHQGQWEVRLAPDGHPEFLPPAWLDPTRLPRRNHYHRRP
ncbi:DUF222 domain-containing protein [Solwaraspora sp. WMMD1047]|uniref:HNH endonuclease signature motif containing protein n=1 Tax=Solwaraspora sp. WMMD1047 TaxID=3016102 RepID=UPI002416D2EF|nr:HNH endonuclease signature motif containing protein [Solwaraspora sp. WMMD1047]MDG4830788.1 DUF222 domain-containing protein [Solwaraspora sp. WMMD1047]